MAVLRICRRNIDPTGQLKLAHLLTQTVGLMRVKTMISVRDPVMSYPAHSSRPVVIRANRETIALLAAAITTTFLISYAVHAHRPVTSGSLPRQEWTGALADLNAEPILLHPEEAITSASLVVPKSELALPPMPPMRPLIRMRGCEGSACVAKTTQTPNVRQKSATSDQVALLEPKPMLADAQPPRGKTSPTPAKPGFMSRVNPLNHLPDVTVIRRPFTFAGETVGGWFRRF